MTPPSDRVPFFNEAAREAAARVIVEYEQRYAAPNQDHRNEARDALNAALEALPPRSKAILALAELTDEELVELIGEGFAERENARRYEGSPHTSPMVEPTEYEASDFEYEARVVLTALGLPVAERETTG